MTAISSKLPRVLVLLATYNGASWLAEQLDSILGQLEVDVFVEVSDDASSDDTRAVIEMTGKASTRILQHFHEQASGSAGANFRRLFRTADASRFDYVALSDQDDIWHPRKLISAIEALHRVNAQGYSCSVRAFWPGGAEALQKQQSRIRRADFLFEGAGQGCTFVLRRELFDRVSAFCKSNASAVEALHYHDWLIYLLARAWNSTWYFDENPYVMYRQHEDNELGSRTGWKSISKRLEKIKNGWYSKQVSAALLIYRMIRDDDVTINRFSTYLTGRRSFRRRLDLSIFFIANGRRRLVDRLIIATAAGLGWI